MRKRLEELGAGLDVKHAKEVLLRDDKTIALPRGPPWTSSISRGPSVFRVQIFRECPPATRRAPSGDQATQVAPRRAVGSVMRNSPETESQILVPSQLVVASRVPSGENVTS